jgi:hypothetical protein
MRRKIPYRVCSCRPNGVVTHLETRLLKEIINREIHPIRCAEKYDAYYDEPIGLWEEEMKMAEAEQETQQMFRDGQGDNLPPCAQDFTEYWHGGPHSEDFSWLDY